MCKLDMHKKMVRRGYIAMLAVDQDYRRKKIGKNIVIVSLAPIISFMYLTSSVESTFKRRGSGLLVQISYHVLTFK